MTRTIGVVIPSLILLCAPACKDSFQAGVDYGSPDAALPVLDGAAGSDGGAGGGAGGQGSGGSTISGGIVVSPSVDAGGDEAGGAALCSGAPSAAQFWFAPGYTPDPSVVARVQTLLATMSLSDEADQLRGMPYGSAEGIQMNDLQRSKDTASLRGFRYRDGSRGMNLAEDIDGTMPQAGQYYGTNIGYSTVFPVSIARGATFDVTLEHAIGEAIGDELQAARQTVLLAPCTNLLRHPLWGRAQETYGEDSFHVGRLASAMVIGAQRHVAATAKHFMAYDIEAKRITNNSVLDEQTLRESYGRHFRMVVRDAGVASVMASYNMVNGTKSTENRHLLTEVLRDDFGFRGFVMSDWWAMTHAFTVASASDLKITAQDGIHAGLDVELPWALNYGQLENIVNTNAGLTKADLDRAAARVLEQKLRFNAQNLTGAVGLGTPITSYDNGRIRGNQSHIDLAQRAALESMVLLKNDSQTLPIPKTVKKVAVLGLTLSVATINDSKQRTASINLATDPNTGDMGSSRAFFDPAQGVGPFAGIRAAAPAGVSVTVGSSAAEAADADFVVVVAGLTAQDEGEEYTTGTGDRASLALDAKIDPAQPSPQNALITAAASLGKPMVVVLEGGGAIDMPWLANVPAVVMAFYPGMVGGAALGQLLWGDASFSGKLPFTWPRQLGDLPPFSDPSGSTTFDYYVGYHYYDRYGVTPLYPFGHGLSYAHFEYRKLELPCGLVKTDSGFPVQVTLANTGSVDADETVMVFVSYPNSTARRPAKELKGFSRLNIKAGQELTTTIYVRASDLDYWDGDAFGHWVIEPDVVQVHVGPNAGNLPLSGTLTLVK